MSGHGPISMERPDEVWNSFPSFASLQSSSVKDTLTPRTSSKRYPSDMSPLSSESSSTSPGASPKSTASWRSSSSNQPNLFSSFPPRSPTAPPPSWRSRHSTVKGSDRLRKGDETPTSPGSPEANLFKVASLYDQLEELAQLDGERRNTSPENEAVPSTSKVTLDDLATKVEAATLADPIFREERIRRPTPTLPAPRPHPLPPILSSSYIDPKNTLTWGSGRISRPTTPEPLKRPTTPPFRPQFSVSRSTSPVPALLDGIRPFPYRPPSPEPEEVKIEKPEWLGQGEKGLRRAATAAPGLRVQKVPVQNPHFGPKAPPRGPHDKNLPHFHGHRLALESLRLLREAFEAHCRSYSVYLSLLRNTRGSIPFDSDFSPIRSCLSSFASLTDDLSAFMASTRVCSAWLCRIVCLVRKREDWREEEREYLKARREMDGVWKDVERKKGVYREIVKGCVEGLAFAVASDDERVSAVQGQALPVRYIQSLLLTLPPILRESTSVYTSFLTETSQSLHLDASTSSELSYSGKIEGWYLVSESGKLLRTELKERLRVVLEKATDLRDGGVVRVPEGAEYILERNGGTVDKHDQVFISA